MENNRRLIWVLEQELAQDIEDDGDNDEGRKSSGNDDGETMLRDLRIQRENDGLCEALSETHCTCRTYLIDVEQDAG